MKKPILILLQIGFAIIAKAQVTLVIADTAHHPKISPTYNVDVDTRAPNPNQKVDPNQIYVEVQAEFPGGTTGFAEYIKQNEQAPKDGSTGKVIADFVVELDGTLSNIKILRTPSEDCGTEAIRLLKKSPKWIPGVQNGKLVRTYYTVPIIFEDKN